MFTLYNVRYWMFTSLFTLYHRPLDKYAQLKKKVLISQPKDMLWVH